MKPILYFILFVSLLLASRLQGVAQETRTDYFMESSNLRHNHNPAFISSQSYVTIPSVGASVKTNSLNLDNLTFSGPNGKRVTFIHGSVDDDYFLNKLSKRNYVNANATVKIFEMGFFRKKAFWTVGLNVRANVDASIPKSLFALVKKGFVNDDQTHYNLSNLTATAEGYAELAVSYARTIRPNLTVGVRSKFLLGIIDGDLNARSLEVDAGPEYWSAKSHVTFRGSAQGARPKYDNRGYIDGFKFGNFTIPGYGLGFDLGVSYNFKKEVPALKDLYLSASLNDIGFITWTNNNSMMLHSPETEVIIRPNDYSLNSSNDDYSLSNALKDAFNDIKHAINLQGDRKKGYTRRLSMTLNLGAEYKFLKNKLSTGLLYTAHFGQYYTTSEISTIITGTPCYWFSGGLSYSIRHGMYDTFGLALNFTPQKGVHVFLASDYLMPRISSDFLPTTSKALNLQIGMSIPLGGKIKKP